MGGNVIEARFYGHVSVHTDIIYALANGQLRPEEPLLAGVRLSYPFLSHAHVLAPPP